MTKTNTMLNVPFLGYKVSARGKLKDAISAMDYIPRGQNTRVVATINAHSTCQAVDDPVFENALKNADLLIPDGISIVLASRAFGQDIPERVSGFDFFEAVSEIANQKGNISYFFMGSSDAVLKKMQARLKDDYPHIVLAGTYSPPYKSAFTQEDNSDICERINAVKPDILWVGLTAPKQEKWIEENRNNIHVGFAAAIGAVFDFYAGSKRRAPPWMQRVGLEWLHRLLSEPQRVWRRYIINNPRFIYLVLKSRFSRT